MLDVMHNPPPVRVVVTWHACRVRMPDTNRTVQIYNPEDPEQTWLAYWDELNEDWIGVDGSPLGSMITWWAELTRPPHEPDIHPAQLVQVSQGDANAYCRLLSVLGMEEEGDPVAAVEAMQSKLQQLDAMINTPELVDFPKAVHLEAVHQLQRWGTEDRQGKGPPQWFWLLSHLATRALFHHNEAERIRAGWGVDEPNQAHSAAIAHHREKAVHHCITSAAVLSHWHASVIGKHTAMRPGSATAESHASELELQQGA